MYAMEYHSKVKKNKIMKYEYKCKASREDHIELGNVDP